MKTKLLNIVFIAFSVVFLLGCRKKENLNANNIVGLGGDTWVKSELDEWLYTNFTKPYNIEVKYKWDRSELGEIYKNVAPIKEELVKPVMQAVKEIWVEPYIAVKDQSFLKKYCQKQFYLLGSPSYNSDGTITLGIAEGGRKIILLNLNVFDKNHKPDVNEILHTIHHEFAHILNQNIAVDPEYRKITPNDYTATWYNIRPGVYSFENPALDKILYEADFWGLGFITPYARANKDEDFVEMQSMLLIYGQTYFDNIINNLFIYEGLYIKRNYQGVYERNTDARNKLLRKKAMMVSYLDSWGINFADLQTKIQAAIQNAIPTPDFKDLVGFRKTYYKIAINPQKLTGLSAKFLTPFNTANKAMLAAPVSRYIDNISLIFDTDKTMILRVNYFNPLVPLNSYGSSNNADFKYNISNNNGLITLKYANPQPPNSNFNASRAREIEQYLPALLAYFNDQEFNARWVDDIIPQSKGIFAGFVKIADPSSYLFGTLEK